MEEIKKKIAKGLHMEDANSKKKEQERKGVQRYVNGEKK